MRTVIIYTPLDRGCSQLSFDVLIVKIGPEEAELQFTQYGTFLAFESLDQDAKPRKPITRRPPYAFRGATQISPHCTNRFSNFKLQMIDQNTDSFTFKNRFCNL